MTYDYLLPIGSVVRLKKAEKLLMIIGFLQMTDENRRFDYTAVTYPEGFVDPRLKILFNHDEIDEVLFTGYDTKARQALMALLAAAAKIDETQNANNQEHNNQEAQ